MSFLKNIFAKKEDDVPQMHIRHNEPKAYYNKELKCWMIPGEEEEKMKEIESKAKGPPKVKKDINPGDLPLSQSKGSTQIKKKPAMANRYASALPSENLADVKVTEPEEVIKSESILEQPREENMMDSNMFYSVQENLNIEKVSDNLENKQEEIEISNPKIIQNINLNQNDFLNQNNIKEIEENLRTKLEQEFSFKFMEMESNMNFHIEELKETIQFLEETSQEEQNILKNQLNTFISENLELKFDNERKQDELNFKQKEIEQYHDLLNTYRKNIEETREFTHISPESVDSSRSDEYVMISTKVEKLEYEKLILNNDLNEAKREISNLNMERTFLDYKLKEIENINHSNLEKLKENLFTLEKKYYDIELQNKFLTKSKESLEKDSKRIEELLKLKDELMSELNLKNEEMRNLKDLTSKMNSEIKSLNAINSQFKINVERLNIDLEEKDFNYTKVIRELREKINEQINEIENIREEKDENSETHREFVDKISQKDTQIFNQNKIISTNEECFKELKNILILSLKSFNLVNENKDAFNSIIYKLNNLQISNEFLLEFNSTLKSIENEYVNSKNQNKLSDIEITLLNEQYENLIIEVEILNESRHQLMSEISKLKDNFNLSQENNTRILKEKEILLKENYELKHKSNNEEMVFEMNELKMTINKLNENLNNEYDEKDILQSKNNNIQNQIFSLNEEIQNLNENIFSINFTNEKFLQEVKMRENILNQILNDYDYIQIESNIEVDEYEFIEAKIANILKQMTNLIEKYQNENTLRENELTFYKEEIERKEETNNLLEDQINNMKLRNNLIKGENKSLNREKKDLEEKINNLMIESNKPDVNQENKDNEIESLREKARKLKLLLENTTQHYESGIETLKVKQKQKLNEMKTTIENLNEENNIIKEQSELQIQEILREKELIRENLEKVNQDFIDQQDIILQAIYKYDTIINNYNISDPNNDPFTIITKLIDKLHQTLENQLVKLKESQSSQMLLNTLREENEDYSKRLRLLETEQEVLIDNINDKNVELNDLRMKISDLESNLEMTQSQLDEVNKNYEFMLKNHKSAEKLNELQKKIQHLNEEKIIISQSHGLIVESLTKEINELTVKLNNYMRNDKNLVEEIHLDNENKVHFKEQPKIENLEKTILLEKSTVDRIEKAEDKGNLGFFSRYLAPIFLTESEIDSISQNTQK